MRDLLSKLDKIVAEETTLQDLEQHPMAKDPVIAKAIADKKRQEQPEETLENDDVSEDIFQIGDDFGISFTEDFEISTEISDILEDGILIDLDEHAIELLQKEGITFVDVDLTEAKKKDEAGQSCWKGYRKVGTKPGTGRNAGKRVNDCEKIGEDSDVEESGLQYYTGKKKYGKDGMTALAQAGREGASEEELGRIKDKYKKEETELEEKSYPFAGRAVGHKEGPAGQWRNKGPKAKKPAQTGDLVGSVESVEHDVDEAKYQGREVPLGKPMAGDVKKSKVYVRGPKGNVVKVNFGDKKMKIKKSNPKRRKSFRARHNCANPGPRWKARYWSCRAW